MVREFANGSGDLDLILGQVIPNIQKMVLDVSLLNTQHYEVQIKCKWSNQEKEVAPFRVPHVVAIEKGAFGSPSPIISQLIYIYIYMWWIQ